MSTRVFAKQELAPPSLQSSSYDSIRSERDYWTLLHAADDSIFRREFEAEFLLLLNKDEKAEYTQLPSLAVRKVFIEYYWKAYNPNPLLPANDRLLVHLRRRAYARKQFPARQPPYYDDRGKYHIKYGKPASRLHDIGGLKRLRETGVDVSLNSYTIQENESWSYVNITPNYVVHFAKAGDSFHEIHSLKELFVGSQRLGLLVWYLSDVLKGRFWMSSAINETVTEIQAIETSLRSRGGGRSAWLKDSENTDFQLVRQVLTHIDKAEEETKRASLHVPPTAYESIHAISKLPFAAAIAQFRGPAGQTRMEITLWSPLKNFVARLDSISGDTVNVEFACLLRNETFDSLAGARWQNKFPAKAAVLANLPDAVGNMTIIAPPQPGELNLQVKNQSNGKLGFSQQNLAVRDFRGRDLMMSDIQFFVNVTDANQQQALPVIEREGFTLAPYPYEEVHRTLPLFFYFEVYNLKSADFENEYEITYKVIRTRGQENILKKLSGFQDASISITNTRTVTSETSQELLAIDVNRLEKGDYRLEITVADAKKLIMTSAKKEFSVAN
ncbi:MAG: GWxTD domain-containing protein [candidate division KSB1 bacterium]|nr:GWxTD domain-containing protein [candidate division KSB1 bacterium]MDZ7367939.1 GWxTD domain-containing protein [candidate division KSB1 bacterium]MDZ7405562.1 GWxTD domain-containing protein [candidate division KSB1 bacterium]